jgi:hypothetical protein
MQHDAPAQVIARVPKNKNETVVVALDEFKGMPLVHVRQHYVDAAGEDRPTHKGICINVTRLPELRAALEAAEDAAINQGLLPARSPLMSKPKRRRNSILEGFIAHPLSLRLSPAWRALPNNARRILDRLEVEHMQHGGADNARLPCTYTNFEKAGVRRKSVALAIRQCVALGFVEVTHKGGRSISQYKTPSRYRLTYVNGRSPSPPPIDDWKLIASDEAAAAALASCEIFAKKPGAKTSSKDERKRPSQMNGAGAKTPLLYRGRNAPAIYISGRERASGSCTP